MHVSLSGLGVWVGMDFGVTHKYCLGSNRRSMPMEGEARKYQSAAIFFIMQTKLCAKFEKEKKERTKYMINEGIVYGKNV